jgi:hypothetical protein
MNVATGFAQQGIVHSDHQRLIERQIFFDGAADMIKHSLVLEAVPRIEAVIGRPILLVSVLGAQQGADGATAKAGQLGQQMPAGADKTLGGGEKRSAAMNEFF